MDPIDNHPDSPSPWAGLQIRAASALVLALVTLGALWQGGWLFMLLIIVAGLLMLREWDGLTAHDVAEGKLGWRIAGLFYVGVPCASLIWLRDVRFENYPRAGAELVLYIFFVVWATDIGAYFAGRKIGGRKLAPVLSPSKTWAGLGGGIVCAAIVGGICASFTPYPPSIIAALDVGAVIAVVAQGGDLFESWLKRRAGVKDSGTLIPGHGGLLDRVDGMVFTLPVFAWLVYMSGNAV